MTKTAILLAAWLSIVVAGIAGTALADSPETAAVATEKPTLKSVSVESARNIGTVEGVVRYMPDSSRPWKFSRYFVQNSTGGTLSEAVVALEGSSLAALAKPDNPKSCTMDQVNFQFVPETMAIRTGDLVRITNSDDALHNVMTSDGGKPFNMNVAKGKEFTHAFERAGGLNNPIRLGCVFHGGMRAWIYVFDHPWFKVTERDGRFRFENVPAGEYTIGVIHSAGKLRRNQRIVVKPNEKSLVEISLSPDDLNRLTTADN